MSPKHCCPTFLDSYIFLQYVTVCVLRTFQGISLLPLHKAKFLTLCKQEITCQYSLYCNLLCARKFSLAFLDPKCVLMKYISTYIYLHVYFY